ncbi:MAG TPA: ABC transporter permease [Acidimicrobiales bacterium]|nr:ABC transporter permease [Acidimicrobiales bacterium]
MSDLTVSGPAPRSSRLAAQTRVELLLTLRRGESLLLTFAIPVGLLVFFAKVDLLGIDRDEVVDFLYPGIVALAVLSTAMVSLAIATGFERSTGVLKRLAVTPLRRGELLAAKTCSIVAIEILQIIVLTLEGFALGWRPEGVLYASILAAIVLGTIAFAGLGLLLAGTLPALTTLAAANGLYIVLLLLGGVIVPIDHFPDGFQPVVKALPATALSEACRGALNGSGVPGYAWAVLIAWAIVTPVLAARFFRWK